MSYGKFCLRCRAVSVVVATLLCLVTAQAQTTSFTYQGRIVDGGSAANGNYDLQFTLFDSLAGGTQIGTTQTVSPVTVSAGVFSVQLDFGASAFPGANRFLEIKARVVGAPAYTLLAPRQQITSTPYAVRALSASTSEGLTTIGSGNFIQNTTTTQSGANFNISGSGTAVGTLSGNILNATTQYNLNGLRILSNAGQANLFAGVSAGAGNDNDIGTGNAFFGAFAGETNLSGSSNSFFGALSGSGNRVGIRNSMIGTYAGYANETGSENSFFGYLVATNNKFGSRNTIIGAFGDFGVDELTNATAVGANARVDQSNSLVLGSIAGVNNANASVNVGIGTTTPSFRLHVKGDVLVETAGSGGNIQFGTPNGESGISIAKTATSRADLRFDGNILKLVAAVNTGPPAATNGLAITTSGNVGIGTVSPLAKLDVNGNARVILAANGTQNVCLTVGGVLASCSSSRRYKTQLSPYRAGLDLINQLQPISFTWKDGGGRDLGLAAEDVAKVEPLLVTHNDKGEIEGVKYDHLNVVLINAIKQQQDQIEELRKEVRELRAASTTRRRRTNQSARLHR